MVDSDGGVRGVFIAGWFELYRHGFEYAYKGHEHDAPAIDYLGVIFYRSFRRALVPGTVIRIYPADAQFKSFVYDANTLRLVAELDENNFAAFFEYDDEGIHIRTKKETEKGIMTIRENRTGVRKN